MPDSAVLPQHECGLFGVFGHPNAAALSYYGLFALQHRGQESAGIAVSDGGRLTVLRDMGLVQGQLWHLDDLATDCAADRVYEFLLAATPLPITHAVGGPVAPTATK